MIPVLTKEQAYKLDKDTIESGHLSQEQLMDNAGKAIAQFFCERIENPFNQKVVVVCGKGNNGGDGVIVHSYLKNYSVSSKILFTEKEHSHTELLNKYKISKSEYSIYNDSTTFNEYDWIVDAIFGVGFKVDPNCPVLDQFHEDLILTMVHNDLAFNLNKLIFNNIISVDIPSSFLADGGMMNRSSFNQATYTLALGYPKLGFFDTDFREYVSTIINIDIGLNKIENHNTNLIEQKDVYDICKKFILKLNNHKYTKHCFVIAGSDKYPGAAMLACKAAYKSGASYIELFSPSSNINQAMINSELCETVILEKINESFHSTRAVLLGPGLNNYKLTDFNFVGLDNIVIDADALNKYALDEYPKGVFTPHFGECRRMFNFPHDDYPFTSINKTVIEHIKDKINHQQIIICKGPSTYIITKTKTFIVDNGPSTLATAGTGDVLSGMLVSLLSQGYARLEASILGAYLHAEAANYYIDNISKDGMTALDLIECIPHAFNKLREHNVN